MLMVKLKCWTRFKVNLYETPDPKIPGLYGEDDYLGKNLLNRTRIKEINF